MKKSIAIISFLGLLSSCGHDIDAVYKTVAAERFEITSKGRSVAVIQAAEEADGKISIKITDMKGNELHSALR